MRRNTAVLWSRHRRSFWSNSIHAYVDNKAFPMPLTAAQRRRFCQTMITGHLRKPSEGLDTGFTKPRQNHSFLGLPSVTISAAVARGRVIMWHVVGGRWNGNAAAAMYRQHLRPGLRRTWGVRPKYTIIEDGDRKGNQSGKGRAAKRLAGISAMTLPPRTPSFMPLDYAIWRRIVKDLNASSPRGKETKEAFCFCCACEKLQWLCHQPSSARALRACTRMLLRLFSPGATPRRTTEGASLEEGAQAPHLWGACPALPMLPHDFNVTVGIRRAPHFLWQKSANRNVGIFFKELNSFSLRKCQRYGFAFCPIKNNACEAPRL